MNRRQFISLFLDPRQGCVLLLDVKSREIVASNGSALAGKILLPPGSALKPFTLAVLGKRLRDDDFVCPERLTLAGRRMDCSHPRMVAPMRTDTALAYSCNCFVAHQAAKFAPGELARGLRPFGFSVQAASGEGQQLQALGEDSVLITSEGLVRAYRQLALQATDPILAGLEGAVEFGTGQLARVNWAKLAGKTGSARMGGQFIAWFAGFVPSRAPQVAVVVMLSGKHGGSDAAPVAAEMLNAWHAGKL